MKRPDGTIVDVFFSLSTHVDGKPMKQDLALSKETSFLTYEGDVFKIEQEFVIVT